MVIIHVDSFCGLRDQVPRCFKENADKQPRMGSVESACKTFLDLASDSEISRYPTTRSAPVDIAPCRADPCIQHSDLKRAVDGLSSENTTWVVASAPYCLTRYDENGAQSFKSIILSGQVRLGQWSESLPLKPVVRE
jgi:hypothetical protein